MSDFNDLADKFYVMANDESEPMIKLAAGRKGRKQLEKDLSYAKDIYSKRRMSLSERKKQLDDLQSAIDRETKDMERTKAEIQKAYKVLENMDLHDIAEIRYINDDVAYVRNRRLFRLDNGDLVPFRRKPAEEEGDDEDTLFVDDIDDAADQLLAALDQ